MESSWKGGYQPNSISQSAGRWLTLSQEPTYTIATTVSSLANAGIMPSSTEVVVYSDNDAFIMPSSTEVVLWRLTAKPLHFGTQLINDGVAIAESVFQR